MYYLLEKRLHNWLASPLLKWRTTSRKRWENTGTGFCSTRSSLLYTLWCYWFKIVRKLSILRFAVHCKYIQCNFYTFYMCPTFHCNLTVLFTFNCCSKYSGINVKLIYSFFTVTSTLDCIWQILVKCTLFTCVPFSL